MKKLDYLIPLDREWSEPMRVLGEKVNEIVERVNDMATVMDEDLEDRECKHYGYPVATDGTCLLCHNALSEDHPNPESQREWYEAGHHVCDKVQEETELHFEHEMGPVVATVGKGIDADSVQVSMGPDAYHMTSAKRVSPAHVALWDAINRVVEASGGDPSNTSVARQKAVVEVERAVETRVKEIAGEKLQRAYAEIRKQTFGSKVVFDREICELADKEVSNLEGDDNV